MNVSFNNFIGFGNRISVEFKILIGAVPKHHVISNEAANTGDSFGICHSALEVIDRTINESLVVLRQNGFIRTAGEIEERIRNASDLSDSAGETLTMKIGIVYELNNEIFYEEPSSD